MPKKGKNKKPKTKKPLASQSSDEQAKLLLECAKQGQIETAQKILEHGKVPTKAIDEAFLAGAEFGHIKVVSLVGSRVSSMMVANAKGETALSLAARNGHIDVAVLLLKIGHNIECRNNNGATPLFAAVEFNQEEMGVFLLERKANVNAVDNSRNSVLHVAAANGHSDIVLMILKAGGSTNVLNDKDETPLEVAKNAEICRIVLEFHTGYGYDHAQDKNRAPQMAISPFRELPPGPASYLFWTAMGVGKDSYMFQNFGVYPFDRLNDTERIIVLTEVAEAMSGYKMDLKCNILNESALYAVFALMKARIKKELEDGEKDDDLESSYLWRKRVLEAYEQVYNTNGSLAGLSIECWQRSVWNTVVNLLARSLFGESFWEKKRMFLSPNALERVLLLKNYRVPEGYFLCKLPSTASIEIQLTFKKLITMSKTFLCDEPVRPSGCFCQDCIAELEVPITFKLQFLEEAAQEKRKNKKGRKAKDRKDNAKEEEANRRYVSENRRKLDELVLGHRKELKSFWSSISIEEKWCLTEMSTTELSDSISNAMHWETLRAALESYAKYAWEEDVLEITEDCVTIADDMCEEKGMHDMLEAMLDAVELTSVQQTPPSSAMTEDEWDKRGRQMLENLVLAEFARKIAAQYVLKKQESRAQQVALELELELLHEEEQQLRAAEKKAKGKKKKARGKKKKKKKSNEAGDGDGDDEEGDEEETSTTSVTPSPASPWTSVSAAASVLRSRGTSSLTSGGSTPSLRHPETKTLRSTASTHHHDGHRHAHVLPAHITELAGKSAIIHHAHTDHILKNAKGRTILPTGITTIRTTHDGKVISVDSGIAITTEPKRIIRRKKRPILSEKKVERKLKVEKAHLGDEDEEEKAPSKPTSTKVLRQTKGQEKILGKERIVYRDSEDDEDDKRHENKDKLKKDSRRQPRKGVEETQRVKEEKDKKTETKVEKSKGKCKKDSEKVQETPPAQPKDAKEKEVKDVKEEGNKKKKGKKRKEEKSDKTEKTEKTEVSHVPPKLVTPAPAAASVSVPQTEEVEEAEEVEGQSEEELSDNPSTPSSRRKRPAGRWAASTNTNNPFAMLTEDEPEEGYRPKGYEQKKRLTQGQREEKESGSLSVHVNKKGDDFSTEEQDEDTKPGVSMETKSKPETKNEVTSNKGGKKLKTTAVTAPVPQPSTWVAKTPPHVERTLPAQPKKAAVPGKGKEEKEVKSVPSTPAPALPTPKKVVKPAVKPQSAASTPQHTATASGTGLGPGSQGSTVSTVPAVGSSSSTASGSSGESTGNWWDVYQDGMMFICTKETYKECMELKLLGLPRQHLRVVRSLRPKTSALFLFNVSDRHLHGVYEATCAGQENMNPAAWARNKTYSRSSPFPAQIEFKVVQSFESIAESAFRHVFTDGNRIRKLDGRQVRDLIQIFRMRARAANRNRTGRTRPSGPATPVKRLAAPSATGGSVGSNGIKTGTPSSTVTTAAVSTTSTSTLNHSPKKSTPRAPVKNVWKLRADAAAAAKKSQEKPGTTSVWKTSPSLASSNPDSTNVTEIASDGTTEEDSSLGQAESSSETQSSTSSTDVEAWSSKEVDVTTIESSEVNEAAQDVQPSETEAETVRETLDTTEVEQEIVEQEQESAQETQPLQSEEISEPSSTVTYEATEETYDQTVSVETTQDQFTYEQEGPTSETNPSEEQEESQPQDYVDSHQEYEGLVQTETGPEDGPQSSPPPRHSELVSPDGPETTTLASPSEVDFPEHSVDEPQYTPESQGSQQPKKNISLFWWEGVWHSSATPLSTHSSHTHSHTTSSSIWPRFEPSSNSSSTDMKAPVAVRHVTWPPADHSRSSSHSHSETHYSVDPVSTSAGRHTQHHSHRPHTFVGSGPTRFETHSLDDSSHRRQPTRHSSHHSHSVHPTSGGPLAGNSHTGWRDLTHSETSDSSSLPSLDYASLEKSPSSFRSSLSLDYGTDFLNSSIWSNGYFSKGVKDTSATPTTFSSSLSSIFPATASGSSSSTTSSLGLGSHSKTFSSIHSGSSVWGLTSNPLTSGFGSRTGEKHSHTQNGW